MLANRVAASPELREITVFDLNPEAVTRFVGEASAGGAAVGGADNYADTVRGADVVFTCLPRSLDVQGVADALLRDGAVGKSVWVDCTSGDPEQARGLGAILGEAGCEYIDCAVSGGPKGALNGTLTAMLGVPEDSPNVPLFRPLVAEFASNIVHCGPTGSGFAIKAVNNAMMGTHILVAAEVCVRVRAGVYIRARSTNIRNTYSRSHSN